MFKNILAPVTPSSYCERSSDTAIAFAQRFESKLVLLHVYGFEHQWGEAELLGQSGDLEKIRTGIEKHYREKLAGVPDHKIAVTQGVPHVEIVRVAREMDADLIVMCPYRRDAPGQEGLTWTRVGSTMERVSREAHCPVMIVSRETPYGEHAFRNILATTDFSRQSRFVVEYAAQMAQRYGAALTVFNVLDTDCEARLMAQDEITHEIMERKLKMGQEYDGLLRGVQASCECWEGQPGVEILKMARMKEADLILMARHGREKDPEKALLGSTVAHVAVRSLCPVMSINHRFRMRGNSA